MLRGTVAELTEGTQLRRTPCPGVRGPEALLGDPHLAETDPTNPHLGITVPYLGAPFRRTCSL